MDDIIESIIDFFNVQKLMQDIEILIIKDGFKLKEWVFFCDLSNGKKFILNELNVVIEKVLGVNWDLIKDYLCFLVKFNFFLNGKCKVQKDYFNNDLKFILLFMKWMILL